MILFYNFYNAIMKMSNTCLTLTILTEPFYLCMMFDLKNLFDLNMYINIISI